MAGTFTFQWHITNACDQRCRHCYIYARDDVDSSLHTPPADLGRILRNIQRFGTRFSRRPYLYLTGGDPLLHPSFPELTDRLRSEKISFSVLGNPFHLTADICRGLRKDGCEKYQMSLDGLEETHDAIRRPGSWRETVDRLPLLKEAGIRTVIMATVSQDNIGEILPLMDRLKTEAVDLFAFARFCNTSSPEGNGIEPLQYRQLLVDARRQIQKIQAQGYFMELSPKDHLNTLLDYEEGLFRIPEDVYEGVIYDGCNCGGSHLTILPDGTVYACRRIESPVGNALDEDLADIWLGDKIEAYRDFRAFSKCTACELLGWCRGCPAVAGAAHGNFYAPDPQCWKDMPVSS